MSTQMTTEIYFDARTAAQWGAVTRVIPKGFICIELNSNFTKLKVGDGVDTYEELPYVSGNADTTEFYTKEEVDATISAAISGLGNIFTKKGRVDNVDDLPKSGMESGDVYLVGLENATEFEEYYWTGTFWDYMGKTNGVDLTNYYTKSEVDDLLSDCVKSTDKLILNCVLGES